MEICRNIEIKPKMLKKETSFFLGKIRFLLLFLSIDSFLILPKNHRKIPSWTTDRKIQNFFSRKVMVSAYSKRYGGKSTSPCSVLIPRYRFFVLQYSANFSVIKWGRSSVNSKSELSLVITSIISVCFFFSFMYARSSWSYTNCILSSVSSCLFTFLVPVICSVGHNIIEQFIGHLFLTHKRKLHRIISG